MSHTLEDRSRYTAPPEWDEDEARREEAELDRADFELHRRYEENGK